jgi:hypothetical protein
MLVWKVDVRDQSLSSLGKQGTVRTTQWTTQSDARAKDPYLRGRTIVHLCTLEGERCG